MSYWYFQPVFGSYAAVAAIAAVLALLLLIGPSFRPTTPRRRLVLVALRLAVILLVLLAMLRPTRISTVRRPLSATLVLAFDTSRSMQVGDAADGRSRYEAQRETIRRALPALDELARRLEVNVYAYDDGARPIEYADGAIAFPDVPEGDQTDIGTALDDITRRELGKRLVGVILLGDGAQRAYAPRVELQQAARELARLGVPLHTIAFGLPRDRSQARNVAVENMQDEYRVFVRNELAVRAQVRVEGFVNQDLPVELIVEDQSGAAQSVATQRIRAVEDGELIDVELRYLPEQAGQYKLTLRVPPQPGELVEQDNQLSAYLTVLEGGLKALYLEGEARFEQVYLRRSLGTSADIRLDFLWIDHRLRDRWPVDLGDKITGGQYDVFLLGDLDSTALGERNLADLAAQVDAGKGLIMLGGYHSFGPGGYGRTPLADVLPIEFDRFERQDFDAPLREDLHLSGPLALVPATDHYLMRLTAAGDQREHWLRLRPLTGANRFSGLKPRAVVLGQSAEGAPLLVAGEYGLGRVLAFAGDSTWQWWMQSAQAQEDHRRFWRQVVLWLARKDHLEQQDVWIRLAQRRFAPGARVEFRAGVRTAGGAPATDVQLKAEVVLPDGERRPARLAPGDADLAGVFEETRTAGDYTLEVTASRGGQLVAAAETGFLIFEQDLEMSDPSARPQQLAALAEITAEHGGRTWAPEQLPALLAEIAERPPEMEIEVQERWQLGDTRADAWLFFLLLVLLLTWEWFFRKRWGLV